MEHQYEEWESVFSKYEHQSKKLRKQERVLLLKKVNQGDKKAWETLVNYYLPSMIFLYKKQIEKDNLYQVVPFDEYMIYLQEDLLEYLQKQEIKASMFYLTLDRLSKKSVLHVAKHHTKEIAPKLEDIMELDLHPRYAVTMEIAPDILSVLNRYLKVEYVQILCEYIGLGTKALTVKEIARKYQLKEGKVQSMLNSSINALQTKQVIPEILDAFGYTEEEIREKKHKLEHFTNRSLALEEHYHKTTCRFNAKQILKQLQETTIQIYQIYDGNEEWLLQVLGKNDFQNFQYLRHVFYWEEETYSKHFDNWERIANRILNKMELVTSKKQKKL